MQEEDESSINMGDPMLDHLLNKLNFDIATDYEKSEKDLEELRKKKVIVPKPIVEDTETLNFEIPDIPPTKQDKEYDTMNTDVSNVLLMHDTSITYDSWKNKHPSEIIKRLAAFIQLPNGRVDEKGQLTGYIASVVLMSKPAPIPVRMFDPDTMFYGITALKIPFPDECSGKSTSFYDAQWDELKAVLDAVELEALEDNDFVGVFNEIEDCGVMFRTRKWIIVQCGDEMESGKMFEMMNSNTFKKASFYQIYEEGNPLFYDNFRGKIRTKRVSIIDDILKKYEMSISDIMKHDISVIHQERDSVCVQQEKTFFSILRGCFVPTVKEILLWNGPTRGFVKYNTTFDPDIHKDFLFAIPYDTGRSPAALPSSAHKCNTVYGNDELLENTEFVPTTPEIRAILYKMGLSNTTRECEIIPSCVRFFIPE